MERILNPIGIEVSTAQPQEVDEKQEPLLRKMRI